MIRLWSAAAFTSSLDQLEVAEQITGDVGKLHVDDGDSSETAEMITGDVGKLFVQGKGNVTAGGATRRSSNDSVSRIGGGSGDGNAGGCDSGNCEAGGVLSLSGMACVGSSLDSGRQVSITQPISDSGGCGRGRGGGGGEREQVMRECGGSGGGGGDGGKAETKFGRGGTSGDNDRGGGESAISSIDAAEKYVGRKSPEKVIGRAPAPPASSCCSTPSPSPIVGVVLPERSLTNERTSRDPVTNKRPSQNTVTNERASRAPLTGEKRPGDPPTSEKKSGKPQTNERPPQTLPLNEKPPQTSLANEGPPPSPSCSSASSSSSPPPLKLYPLLQGDGSRTVKLQHNRGGGGCFPLHYDNPGPPSRRALTCILYLNPGWAPGDGGELQLIPFMRRPVRIAPKHDRLAVFLSDRVLHRVLPSNKERFCLTVWLDGEGVNAPEDVGLRLPPSAMRDVPGTAASLFAQPAQRALSRAVYSDEYEASLMECMAGADGCSEMLASHTAHLRAVGGNAPLKALVDALRRFRAETADTEDELLV